MKKSGIVCDNYKVDKFQEELTKEGFEDYEVKELAGTGTTLISVNVPEENLLDIKRICGNVELYFHNSN